MKIKLSIIIPVYNAEMYLIECIERIRNQRFCDYEVILINDGSSDNSKVICERYEKLDCRFKLINQKNQGVSKARNEGIKKAVGDYILFIDSDDYIENDFLNTIINNLEDTQLLCYGYNKLYKTKKVPIILNENIDRKENVEYEILFGENIGGFLWNKIFKREIIINNNLNFSENIFYCEDLLFVVKYLQCIKKAKYINKIGYYYRMRKNSASGKFQTLKNCSVLNAFEEIIKLYNNNPIYTEMLKQIYLIYYYKLKKIILKNKIKVNSEFLKVEKRLSLKYKIKIIGIKYLYPIYQNFKMKILKKCAFE